MSVDAEPAHRAFATSLGGVPYPLLADFHPKGATCQQYGVYDEETGLAKRAVFLIDKEGVVRFKKGYSRGLPNTQEVLRELDKLEGPRSK